MFSSLPCYHSCYGIMSWENHESWRWRKLFTFLDACQCRAECLKCSSSLYLGKIVFRRNKAKISGACIAFEPKAGLLKTKIIIVMRLWPFSALVRFFNSSINSYPLLKRRPPHVMIYPQEANSIKCVYHNIFPKLNKFDFKVRDSRNIRHPVIFYFRIIVIFHHLEPPKI